MHGPGASAGAPAIRRDADLSRLSTFALPARSRELTVLENPADLPALLDTPLPVMVLGGGSNTLFLKDFPGRIIINRCRGIESEPLDDQRTRVRVGAGENWHRLVIWSLRQGLSGLENLALIPGSVGAAPMQNIGAYGVELSDCLLAVEAWDRNTRRPVTLKAEDCQLGYRSSRFRTTDRDRFIITAVCLALNHEYQRRIEYRSLGEELARVDLNRPDARQTAAAVMRIRRRKLPNPATLANAGSFFKNPVVDPAQAGLLQARFPDLPGWPAGPGKNKLSAAWMIEHTGWKGRRMGPVGVHAGHALVLVNHGGGTGRELVRLAESIQASVQDAFGVRLEPEPGLVGLPRDSTLAIRPADPRSG